MRQADEKGASTEDEDEEFNDNVETKSDEDSPSTFRITRYQACCVFI